MINQKKIIVVLPALNAEKTLVRTYEEIPKDIVDEVILVDDGSSDRTVEIARSLPIEIVCHKSSKGYGANQKTCYRVALERNADIVVLLHPDYQYPPSNMREVVAPIAEGKCDAVLTSRFLNDSAKKGKMPLLTYIANRLSKHLQNLWMKLFLSEYHSGYRAFSKEILTQLPLVENSDGFLFDSQMFYQILHFGFTVKEIPTPCLYHPQRSSIGIFQTCLFSIDLIRLLRMFSNEKNGRGQYTIFSQQGRRLMD